MTNPSHGGKQVSTFLKDRLHSLIEDAKVDHVSELITWTRETHGGYFKRWRGGALHRWTEWANGDGEAPDPAGGITLDERLTLAFLEVRLPQSLSDPNTHSRRISKSLLASSLRKPDIAVRQPLSFFSTLSTTPQNHIGQRKS